MSEERQIYVPKSALDSFSNALFAERLELGSREPMLTVGINVNQKNVSWSTVDVKVMHYIRGEERNKSFDAPTKPMIVHAALQRLAEYAVIPFDSEVKKTTSWDIRGPKIVGGKMSNERITKAKLVVGRNKKGVFISVVHWNSAYPHIAFYPGLNDENNVMPSGSDDPEKVYEYVCATAKGWAAHIGGLLGTEWSYYINKALEVMRRNQSNSGGGYNGGGNYGSNNNNGSSGGNNYSAAPPKETNGDEFNF